MDELYATMIVARESLLNFNEILSVSLNRLTEEYSTVSQKELTADEKRLVEDTFESLFAYKDVNSPQVIDFISRSINVLKTYLYE